MTCEAVPRANSRTRLVDSDIDISHATDLLHARLERRRGSCWAEGRREELHGDHPPGAIQRAPPSHPRTTTTLALHARYHEAG